MEEIIFKEIAVSLIDFSGENPRKSMRHIEELAENISENGLINSISVKKKKNGRFEIVSGERRFRACTKILGWGKMKVFIKTPTKYEALAENLAREDMSIVEKVPAITKLLQHEFGSNWKLILGRAMNGKTEELPKKMHRVLAAIGTKAGTLYQQLPILALTGKVIERILEHPEYYNDAIILKLARLKDEKLQLNISRSISRRDIIQTNEVFRAINQATYEIKGVSPNTAKWLDWEEQLKRRISDVVSYLRKIDNEKPAPATLLNLHFTLQKLKGEINKAKENIKQWETKQKEAQ